MWRLIVIARQGLVFAASLLALAHGLSGCDTVVSAGAQRPAAEPHNPWFQAGRAAVDAAPAPEASAKNLILFVGDGMGVPTVTAARIYQGQSRGGSGEENLLAFERLPHVALAKTYNTDFQVPDSAGTMTALVSGLKTRAGILGVDDRVARGDFAAVAAASVPSLIDRAEEAGLATGIVTTARLTHATPAACYAHSADRDWESDADLPETAKQAGVLDIARQLVAFDSGDGLEVVLGGGRAAFLPAEQADVEHPEQTGARRDGRDLVAEWRKRHPSGTYVWNLAQFRAVDPASRGPVLGLFSPSHMSWEADRQADPGGEPSLAEMTEFALKRLGAAPKGFVLVVEAGRIDHAHHAGNAYRALVDTVALSDAVAVARASAAADETLIVVTADHGHVLSLAGYPARGNPILGLARAPGRAAAPGPLLRDALGLPYTTLSYANGPGYPGASNSQPAGPKRFPHFPRSVEPAAGRPDLEAVDTRAPSHLQEATLPLLAETHSGEDVPVYAGGPGAELIHGVQEQNYFYHAFARALGWTKPR